MRWFLCAMCSLMFALLSIDTFFVMERSAAVEHYVKVQFDVPPGGAVYADGKRVIGDSAYLSSKHAYRMERRVNGVTVKEEMFTPQQVGNLRCTW